MGAACSVGLGAKEGLFELDRPQKSDAVAVGPGGPHSCSSASPRMPLGGVVRAVRTIIDDDEIVGFETTTSGQRIDAPSGPRLFEDASVEALNPRIRRPRPPWRLRRAHDGRAP